MLSGSEIASLLKEADEKQRLVITPFFSETIQLDRGAASVDLRLGSRFSAAKRLRLTHLDSDLGTRDPRVLVDEYYIPLRDQFVLHPQHFVLATTLEWIRLPATVGGYVIGRSTFGRRGLIIATAAGVHPSYSGVLTLELTNVGETPITVKPGQPICQLFLHAVQKSDADAIDRSSFVGSLYPSLGSAQADDIESFLANM